MSLTPLDNPLERLGINPTGMNWRGLWDATEQYYLNDVAVDGTNNASYILAGKTALLGGGDPSLNPDWIELSATTTGVVSVNAGVGITMTGTGTNPIVNNAGVVSFTAGTGLTNAGTASNPLINNTGVVALTQGVGIQITGTTNPTITNTGIRTLTQGAGIAISAGSNPSIANTGLLSAVAGTGISVSVGQNPTIANTGVLGVSGGTGITITGSASNPVINNTQVDNILSVIPLNPASPILSGPVPLQTTAFNDVVVYLMDFSASPAIYLQWIQASPPAGVWVLDLTGFCFAVSPDVSITTPAYMSILLRDNIGNEYAVPASQGGQINLPPNTIPRAVPYVLTAGKIIIDLGAVKTALGGTTANRVVFQNLTTQDIFYTSYPSIIPCTYFPNGIQ
jgi:hypothetical protein